MKQVRTSFLLVAVSSLFGTVGSGFAQDSRSAIQQFRQAFRPIPKDPKGPPQWRSGMVAPAVQQIYDWSVDRLSAIRLLAPHHGADVAKVLSKTATSIDKELMSADSRRAKLKKTIDSAFKSMTKGGRRINPSSSGYQKYIKASLEAGRLRAIRDGLENQHAEINGQIGALDGSAVRTLLGSAIGDKRLSLSFKLAVTRRAGVLGKEMIAPLATALGKARAPHEIAAVVEGLGTFKSEARSIAGQLIPLLDHADEGVRERAALALSQIAVPGAIEPMIKLLARESGMAKKRIAAALEILTRQKHGQRVDAWQKWLAAEGEPYLNGHKELGGGKPSGSEAFNKENYYYGIAQDGKSILYILDCSGSMAVSYKDPRFQDPQTRKIPLPARGDEVSRMRACKDKLSQTIGRLTSDQRFNIIWYSYEPKLYKKKMQQATAKNVKAAQDFLETLSANGATNIYDTMQLAFEATGRGTYDKAYGVDCDMMFLLTDGKPTLAGTSDGYDMVESIITGVRRWNALKRVVIHTIGIGMDLNDKFMEQLATENGGEYRNEEGKKKKAKKEKAEGDGKGDDDGKK